MILQLLKITVLKWCLFIVNHLFWWLRAPWNFGRSYRKSVFGGLETVLKPRSSTKTCVLIFLSGSSSLRLFACFRWLMSFLHCSLSYRKQHFSVANEFLKSHLSHWKCFHHLLDQARFRWLTFILCYTVSCQNKAFRWLMSYKEPRLSHRKLKLTVSSTIAQKKTFKLLVIFKSFMTWLEFFILAK